MRDFYARRAIAKLLFAVCDGVSFWEDSLCIELLMTVAIKR